MFEKDVKKYGFSRFRELVNFYPKNKVIYCASHRNNASERLAQISASSVFPVVEVVQWNRLSAYSGVLSFGNMERVATLGR